MGTTLLPRGHPNYKKSIPPPKPPPQPGDPYQRIIDKYDKLDTLPPAIKDTLLKHWKVFEPLTPGVKDKYVYDGEVIPLSENSTPFRKM
jgi:hypothetical protein